MGRSGGSRREHGGNRDALQRHLRQRVQDIPDGVRFAQDLERKPHPKGALDAQDQLGPPKAVDAEVAIELAGAETSSGLSPADGLAHQFANNGDEGALARGLVLSRVNGIASMVHYHGKSLASSSHRSLTLIKGHCGGRARKAQL